MKKLDEFNKEQYQLYHKRNEKVKNGIECPDCENELHDTCPEEILLSHPPRKHVHCDKCGFVGNRVC